MICWISGVACSGKSTLIKSLLNESEVSHQLRSIYKPIKEFSCVKFQDFLLVGSNYLNDKVKTPGIDSSKFKKEYLESLIDQEYLKHNILLETFLPHLFNLDIILSLISKYNLKIFYLHTNKNTLDKRGIERNQYYDKQRTEKIKSNQLKRTELVINHNMVKPYVTILENSNKKDLSNNVKLIKNNIMFGITNKDH